MERGGYCREGCGACCKLVLVNVNPVYMEPDKKSWLELHEGLRLFRQNGGVWMAIQTSCRHLTADNKCGIFGQPERPQTCDDFPFAQNDIDLLNDEFNAGCTYSFA